LLRILSYTQSLICSRAKSTNCKSLWNSSYYSLNCDLLLKGLPAPSATNLQLSLWAPDQVRCDEMRDCPATWKCGNNVMVGVALIKPVRRSKRWPRYMEMWQQRDGWSSVIKNHTTWKCGNNVMVGVAFF